MNKIATFLDSVKSKLYYSRPVYVPGYKYSPWKIWLIIAAIAIIALVFVIYVGQNPSAGDSNSNTHPPSTQNTQPTSTATHGIHKEQSTSLPNDETYLISRIIDGDTIDVDINGKTERVRLIGLDTPETVDPRKPVECYGNEASSYLRSFTSGKSVKLETDSTQSDRDAYGRLLRYAYLPDGTNIANEMIREGYGHEYTYRVPYRLQTEFKKSQSYARSNQLGLWANKACG